jgi:predicted DNA-binding transcriptional regulator AlpA
MASRPEVTGKRLLSYDDLNAKGINWSRQWIRELIKEDKFPKPVQLGEGTPRFIEDEIDEWIASLINTRNRGEQKVRSTKSKKVEG